ncbi:sodium:solute symporter family protein [Sinanaerobacter chloroacetimidivorans]|uniref:Sodium:solute symporter family protein n=1 Tax=Sinanaerobacter chloroacetimidivorans TaxID=2818044 RepID=A0A8J7W1Q8_9FIRM|nr:sodium:solute symporter family protein [Sinanaerobacter chloroacetimidivorans]MBR0597305.1 sodium:solute symporter family protein [Sinanaerobacter chloroacetimidivorans]
MIKPAGVALIILLFFAFNIFFIIKFHRKQDSFEEYSVGNRSFGWLLYSFSFLGYWYAGALYISGFSLSANKGILSQYLTVYAVASLVILYFMAKPVWVWGKNYNLVTQADFIGLRYGNKLFKTIFSFLTLIFWFPWIIIEMKTIGYIVALTTYSYINSNAGMIIVCLFVIVYTFYGGVRASAIGSMIQSFAFIGLGSLVTGYLIWKIFGGLYTIFPMVESAKPYLLTLDWRDNGHHWASIIITGTLGGFAFPDMFKQLYTADSPRTIKKIVFIAPVVAIMIRFSLFTLGLGCFLISGFPLKSNFSLFWLADSFGGPILLGLFAVISLSASMSTFSAIISTSAIMVCKDWLGAAFRGLSPQSMLKLAKGLTIVIGIISLYIATIQIDNLLNIAVIMFDLIVQAIIPLFIGQYWRKSNLYGAFGGMTVGIVITLMGNFYPQAFQWTGGWSPGIIGLVVNLFIHIACGFVFGKQKHVDEMFDTVKFYKDPHLRKAI